MAVTVALTDEEAKLHVEIEWGIERTLDWNHKARMANLDRIGRLARSLLARRAYFTDPDMNVGGHGKSRRQVFEKNGTIGDALLTHPHFAKHLCYFIHGPALPPEVVRGFVKILDDDAGTSGMVHDQIQRYVRAEVRGRGLEPGDAAEEFFKLAHEVGRPDLAKDVRTAARQARR